MQLVKKTIKDKQRCILQMINQLLLTKQLIRLDSWLDKFLKIGIPTTI